MMQRLGLPGGHMELLDFPLSRPMITVHDLSGLGLPEDDIKDVLIRQYSRLVFIYIKHEMNPVSIPAHPSIEQLLAAINPMMNEFFLGDYLSERGKLYRDDMRDAILRLTENRNAFIEYLSQQNALLGESNNIVLALLGSNFNCQPLLSVEAALCAVFYIIKYISKDSMEPMKLFGFVKAAQEKFVNYPGNIPDGDTASLGERSMRRLGQIVQNGISGSVEIGVQQCIMNVFGLPSHQSSEQFRYIFANQACQFMKRLFPNEESKEDHDDDDDNDEDDDDDDNDEDDDDDDNNDEDEDIPLTSSRSSYIPNEKDLLFDRMDAQEENKESNREDFGTIVKNINGRIVHTSQLLEYQKRGESLCFLSLVEYACTIKVVDKAMPNAIEQGKRKT
jgi:hypothetical protein